MDFKKRFNQLSPTMKWQFNTKAQSYLAPYEGFAKETQNALDDLFTELETADKLKNILLKGNLSSDYMYMKICSSVEVLSKEHQIHGTMGKLAGALAQGDELACRMCSLWEQQERPIKELTLEHPCLIQSDEEYQKWLELLKYPELKKKEAYLKWCILTEQGHSFEEKQHNYIRAVQLFNVNHLPNRKLPYKNLTLNGQFLLERFGRSRV